MIGITQVLGVIVKSGGFNVVSYEEIVFVKFIRFNALARLVRVGARIGPGGS